MNEILLSTAYLPPIQYLSKFLKYRTVWIETEEHFIKQTYRNRTLILAANGPESLVIPIEKVRGEKQMIKDLAISYDEDWRHIHWNAIVSAYNSSPFFDILKYDFRPLFRKKFKYLFDFNIQLLQVILEILEIPADIKFTGTFEGIPAPCLNAREAIHPKPGRAMADPYFDPQPYSQVFDDKFGFVPNLSIIDLLFNCGPASYEILLKSINGDAGPGEIPG